MAACFPGLDPFALSADELLGLAAHIDRIKAERVLEKAVLGEVRLTAEGWFDYTLRATGDRDLAEKAHNAHVRACQRAGIQE